MWSRYEWIIGMRTTPVDAQGAREEARWLKLADDALSQRHQDAAEHLMTPGLRALKKLERATLELEHALLKYRGSRRRRSW
jgi:hypothetical protein